MRKSPFTLLEFKWQRDASGYDLSPDRQRIVRRKGRMVSYDPAKTEYPLHHACAGLRSQIWHSDEIRYDGAGSDAPFHKRRFDDPETACLAFVNEYGFLGSPTWGADAEAEPVEYIWNELSYLGTVLAFRGYSSAVGSPEGFNRRAPLMRATLGKGSDGQYRIQIEPETLQAWMWLRVAQELVDAVDWRGLGCLYCGKPILRGPGGSHRSDAKYCSNGCRTKFNRLSKSEQRRKLAEARNQQRNRQEA